MAALYGQTEQLYGAAAQHAEREHLPTNVKRALNAASESAEERRKCEYAATHPWTRVPTENDLTADAWYSYKYPNGFGP
jgi:hypothetical protein